MPLLVHACKSIVLIILEQHLRCHISENHSRCEAPLQLRRVLQGKRKWRERQTKPTSLGIAKGGLSVECVKRCSETGTTRGKRRKEISGRINERMRDRSGNKRVSNERGHSPVVLAGYFFVG